MDKVVIESRPARRQFTAEEQEKIRALYPTAPWTDLFAAAPGRTRKQIISWADYQGITRETPQAKKVVAKRGAKAAPARKGRPAKEKVVPATPVLNPRVSAKKKTDGPTPISLMLHEMRQLPGGHPRRLAYAQAARNGNGLDALKAWKRWPQQQYKEVANG